MTTEKKNESVGCNLSNLADTYKNSIEELDEENRGLRAVIEENLITIEELNRKIGIISEYIKSFEFSDEQEKDKTLIYTKKLLEKDLECIEINCRNAQINIERNEREKKKAKKNLKRIEKTIKTGEILYTLQ